LQAQDQRNEINELRELNEALKAERRALMLAAGNTSCRKCREPLQVGDGARMQLLLAENARLKAELQGVNTFLKTVSGGRAPELMATAMPSGSHGPVNVHAGKGKAPATDHAPPPPSHGALTVPAMPASSQRDTNDTLVHVASHAVAEFKALVYSGMPMWIPGPDGKVELLNFQSYIDNIFPTSMFGPYRMGVVVDGTRKTGDVMCTVDYLIGALMTAVQTCL
jgi:hypothetical protein